MKIWSYFDLYDILTSGKDDIMSLEKKELSDIFTSNIDDNNLKKILSRTDVNELTSIHKIVEINVDDIVPNPYQPRKTFDEGSLKELADSISTHGLITPILVKRADNSGYHIIAGERRWRAVRLNNSKTIKAVICNLSDKAVEEIALLENIQRENLNILEEAIAYSRLIEKYNYTQKELAQRIGKSREHVANTMRLLKLPDKIKEKIVDGKLSAGHARAIISIEDEDKMYAAADDIVSKKLNVRDTENLVKKIKENKQDGILDEKAREMEEMLHLKVSVSKNKLIIHGDEKQLLQFIENIKNWSM